MYSESRFIPVSAISQLLQGSFQVLNVTHCSHLGYQLAHVLEVDVAGYELGEGVGNGDDRLFKVGIFHPRGAPQSAGTGHVAAMGGGFRTIVRHGATPGG